MAGRTGRLTVSIAAAMPVVGSSGMGQDRWWYRVGLRTKLLLSFGKIARSGTRREVN
jgi:hypothetical protein